MGFHNLSLDSVFTVPASKHPPKCYTCGQYSPFLIYLGYNEKSKKFCPEAKHIQLFCPSCSPDADLFKQKFQEELFRPDSILNDQRLLDLLTAFESDNDEYADEDRIVITENTQLRTSYKTVTKKSGPKRNKLKMLMELFPEAHRMPNRNYADEGHLDECMKQKYEDICRNYMDISEAGGSQLIDHIDIMIDKTPLVERQRHLSRVASIVTPAIVSNTEPSPGSDVILHDSDREIRAGSDSDDEDELASIASAGRGGLLLSGSDLTVVSEVQISSEEPVGHWLSSQSQSQPNVSRQSSQLMVAAGRAGQPSSQPSSQSVDISSQSLEGQKASEMSYGSDSSESCVINMPPPRPARRRAPSADDGQQAGPSGVKRRRVSPRGNRPMNPTPEEIQKNPNQGGRVPRLDGG